MLGECEPRRRSAPAVTPAALPPDARPPTPRTTHTRNPPAAGHGTAPALRAAAPPEFEDHLSAARTDLLRPALQSDPRRARQADSAACTHGPRVINTRSPSTLRRFDT